jgi:HD-GYP domain-containing protein (c-di-GMP phosphodiesterase class II)
MQKDMPRKSVLRLPDGRQSLEKAYMGFIGALANALDARDQSTSGHSQRVSGLAGATAAALDVTGEALEAIRIGAFASCSNRAG